MIIIKKILFLLSLIIFGGIILVAQEQRDVKFAFLTDIHVAPGALSEKALSDIIAEINTNNLDFLVLTGDLTNNGSDAELNTVKNALEKLTIPYYVISGNHETNWSESAGMTFIRLFGGDRFVFEVGNYLFVGFATGPYMKMGDGHAKEEDIHWLKQLLKTRNIKDKTLIVAAHYPMKEGLDNWYEITDVLKEYHAGMVLCGHEHRLSVQNFDGLVGIEGRATVKSGSEIMGYNLITLRNDSAFVTEKELGVTPKGYFTSFSLKNNDVVKGLPVSPRPDFSVNEQYPEVSVQTVIQDSASIFTGAVLADRTLIYGNSKGEMIAWDLAKKKVLWRNQYTGSIYATPSLYKQFVYVGTITGEWYVLDIRSGKQINKLVLGKPIIGESVVDGNFVYVSAGNDFYKMKATTGEMVWKNTDVEGQLQGKPLVTASEVIFGAWDRHLYCLDKISGKLIWKWNNGRSGVLYSPANVVPVVNDGKVFIVAPDRYMTAINLSDGQTVWRTNKHQVRESMGMSSDKQFIYSKLMNDSILCVSANGSTYQEEWVLDAGFGYEHNPCPVLEYNGVVYAGGKNGLLVAIDAKTRQIKWKHKCGNSSINKITLNGKNEIWLTLIEGKIICVRI